MSHQSIPEPSQTVCTHRDHPQGPASALSGKLKCEGHVDNDLLIRGCLVGAASLDNLEVGAADVADVARNVQEPKGGDLMQGTQGTLRLGAHASALNRNACRSMTNFEHARQEVFFNL